MGGRRWIEEIHDKVLFLKIMLVKNNLIEETDILFGVFLLVDGEKRLGGGFGLFPDPLCMVRIKLEI